jgi:hypothetical protein
MFFYYNTLREMYDRSRFAKLLTGKDLRRLRNNKKVVDAVHDQRGFDELFELIFDQDRSVVMRAVDAVEKITVRDPKYLIPHRAQLLNVFMSADHKELKWHIAQLIPRIDLSKKELRDVSRVLAYWAGDENESRLVRVNSLQGLYDLSLNRPELKENFLTTMKLMEREAIPSIQARIRNIKKMIVENSRNKSARENKRKI